MDARDRRIAELEGEVAELRALVAKLREELVEQKRAQHRNASPYSRGRRKENPKKPGRKPGEGLFKTREAPPEAAEPSRTVEAAVTEGGCSCGGAWERSVEVATTTDLPEKPKPEVTKFLVEVCRCKRCGKKVRGRHPELPRDQCGATAHRVGERAKAAAHGLHYGIGIPVQQVPRVLEELTGLSITQSAITQDAQKRAEEQLQPVYEQLRADVASSYKVNTDDTGWRVGGKPAQLMNFNTPDTSLFQIRRQHRNEEVREVIPADYRGVLGTDRGKAYDAKELLGIPQQKCNGHIIRNIDAVLETQDGRHQGFGLQLKDVFLNGMNLHRSLWAGDLTMETYLEEGSALHDGLTYLLRPRLLTNPDNQRLLDQLGWHHGFGNLLRYLQDPLVDPTNNCSERELRGGVKARKVSHCSKNWRGAHAREVIVSIIRTNLRRLRDVPIIEALFRVFRTAKAPPILLLSP